MFLFKTQSDYSPSTAVKCVGWPDLQPLENLYALPTYLGSECWPPVLGVGSGRTKCAPVFYMPSRRLLLHAIT